MSEKYKGIILAGGSGTRLHPITQAISKQIIPIYDKPMIYYSLSVLMLSNIRDILIISTPRDTEIFSNLLGDGSQFGVSIEYAIQEKPNGLAEAFILGEEFIGQSNVCMVLGDNIFFGENFSSKLLNAMEYPSKAKVFAYQVADPQNFGVVEFDKNSNVISIIEKPNNPKSNYAVTGLYYYDKNVVEIAKSLVPSERGELEITDINNAYLKENKLSVELLGRGFAWLDTGNCDSLLEASQFVHTLEKRQGFKIACLEEIAYKNKWISAEQLKIQALKINNSGYGKYLLNLLNNI